MTVAVGGEDKEEVGGVDITGSLRGTYDVDVRDLDFVELVHSASATSPVLVLLHLPALCIFPLSISPYFSLSGL